ncbi:uncharacterized protein TRIADDRAFT_51536 [Trichoplax adhaerens]|uniref:Uncharacterized protein n=1 Tax=Trichoplax adhaerens TaxID=10228 RepID=B3RJP2_TRIAD|nr:hypothetical protein TRIADDRAFT_51536 [Trichoplax adhaerens]EDV28533.1 hypothetical protein TRIADDRAFT_51536 [Trichoplax adhaerens]|eukprot:XP_002107735.1 hypothetical protein TRIADDRAFT_51536 [Trichoplax adhaerens]
MSASLKSQEAPKGPDVVFGTTQNRSLFTEKPLTNRLGGETAFHHDSHLGPGCYENDEMTRSLALLANHVESNRGYGFSSRSAARFPKPHINDFPSPAEYQRPKLTVAKPAYKPFNTAMKLPQIKLFITLYEC